MKKKLILAITGLIVGVVALGAILNFTFNPKPRVIANEKAAFFIPADQLRDSFTANEGNATVKYMDKVLKVSGKITAIEGKSVVLDDKVLVNFLMDTVSGLLRGDDLVIKGRCVGFDELLLQVRIDQAKIHKK
ncbi:MAG: hypothetical protein AAF039_11605 [Bacteroidota bacterium]